MKAFRWHQKWGRYLVAGRRWEVTTGGSSCWEENREGTGSEGGSHWEVVIGRRLMRQVFHYSRSGKGEKEMEEARCDLGVLSGGSD